MLRISQENVTKSKRMGVREKEDCMKRCKRDMGMMLTGIALGALLTGGAAAAGILAEPAWSPIYVNGRQVQMTAYNIAGNNYVKLRDIGKAVGFNVYYQNGVQVDSAASYTGEAPAQTPPAESISVSSYKGNTLKAGDRSGLMISPSGPAYTVTSSNPAVVAVEQVSGNWVAVAKSAGSAAITVSSGAGGTGSLSLTVEGATPAKESSEPSGEIDLNANMEVRQEMIRLINQVRRENGVAELPVNEAIMNATQDISTHRFAGHDPYEWEALRKYGWLYGGLNNQTSFNLASNGNIAQRAVKNWVNSPSHFQALLDKESTYLGVGITIIDDFAYCHMFVGDPNSYSPS